MNKIILLSAGLMLALGGAAYAQAPGGGGGAGGPPGGGNFDITAQGAPLAACNADAKKVCAGKSGMETVTCLQSNQAKLSATCKTAVSSLGAGGPPGGGAGGPPGQ
jgi:hypothetical protein